MKEHSKNKPMKNDKIHYFGGRSRDSNELFKDEHIRAEMRKVSEIVRRTNAADEAAKRLEAKFKTATAQD